MASVRPAVDGRGAGTRASVALQVIVAFVGTLYVVEAVDTALGGRLDGAGVRPREAEGLDGIVFGPLLHVGWDHLLANTMPLLVFGFLILLAGVSRWVAVTATVWGVGGLGVWLTGAEGTLHLGASVLAFGWLVYLIARGVFSRTPSHILVGVVLLVLYGGLLWGVLPGQTGVSWQGHLFGALGGAVAAWWLGSRDGEDRRRRA